MKSYFNEKNVFFCDRIEKIIQLNFLQIGFDRKNSEILVKSILKNNHNIEWLGQINTKNEFNTLEFLNPSVSDSIILGISFLETAIYKNEQALRLL